MYRRMVVLLWMWNCFAVSSYICISPVMVVGAESEAELRRRVLAMWRSRQDVVQSLRAEWAQQRTDTKGGTYRRIDSDFVALPLEDTTFHSDCRFLLQGHSSFYEYRGKGLDLESGQYLDSHSIYTFDGLQSKSLSRTDAPDGTIPLGHIFAEPSNFITGTFDCLPLMWYCRPLESRMGGLSLDDAILKPSSTSLNGRRVIKVDVLPRQGKAAVKTPVPLSWTLWIDPMLDGNVVRAEQRDKNDGHIQFEVSYEGESGGLVRLRHWRFTRQRSGRVIRDIQCHVGIWDVNVDLPADSFSLEFPVGTYVLDSRVSPGTHFIQRGSGRIRPILPTEYGMPYEVLRKSEAPSLWSSAFTMVKIVLVAIAFGGIGWLVVRGYRYVA